MNEINKSEYENGGDFAVPERRRLSPTSDELLAERGDDLPVWIRAPKRGHEHYSGLSRAKLYQLATGGLIKSSSLREPGQVKGTRLFLLSSILGYITKHQIEPTNGNPTPDYREQSLKP